MLEAGATALVTGATGFVGSHLVEQLVARGVRVRCLVRATSNLRWLPVRRAEITLVHGDLDDERALKEALRGVPVVFHLAAVTSAPTDAVYDLVNVGGTICLVAAMLQSGSDALLVFCSSLAAAGPATNGHPVSEQDPPRPITAYGRSKLAAESVVASSGLRHVIVRPPTVYGPRDVDVLEAFRLASRGLALRVGSAAQRLSMIHVRDLANGLTQAAEHNGHGVYYLCDGAIHRWDEIIRAISEAVGRPARVIPIPTSLARTTAYFGRLRSRLTGAKPLLTPDRVRDMVQLDWTCDDTRARRELRYESRITLGDGLRETAAWYRAQGWLK